MRFIMHVSLPPEKFNDAVRDGSAAKKLARILEDAKPEAAYFTTKDGRRGGPPAMNSEDLQNAGLDALANRWG